MTEAQKLADRPSQVSKATMLLWVSLGIGIVISLLDLQYLRSLASADLTITVMVSVLVIMALLIYKISVGRNWARITFLVLFVLGALPYVSNLMAMFSRSALTGSLSLLQLVLQLVALYFIFTHPAASWFKRKVIQ